jgi:hypothetical protein
MQKQNAYVMMYLNPRMPKVVRDSSLFQFQPRIPSIVPMYARNKSCERYRCSLPWLGFSFTRVTPTFWILNDTTQGACRLPVWPLATTYRSYILFGSEKKHWFLWNSDGDGVDLRCCLDELMSMRKVVREQLSKRLTYTTSPVIE